MQTLNMLGGNRPGRRRKKMIAIAACYRAESVGLRMVVSMKTGIKAEAEIDAMLHDRIGKS